MEMSNDLFWTNMAEGDEDVLGLEDLKFPLTNETQQIDETTI